MARRRISHNHGIEHEPHRQLAAADVEQRKAGADEVAMEPVRSSTVFGPGHGEYSEHLHALGDEPALAGWAERPAGLANYADYVAARRGETSGLAAWGAVVLASVVAGPFAVLGSCLSAESSLLAFLSLCLFGPLVEEMLKLAGALYLAEQRPWLLPTPWCVVAIALVSGLEFAIIENLLYLNVYIPEASPEIAAWRWTVCTALHVGCSVIGGVGIALMAREARQTMSPPRLSRAAPFMIAAIMIHGGYNGVVYILERAGVTF